LQLAAKPQKTDSKSAEGNLVGVRPPLPAPNIHIKNQQFTAAIFVCAQNVPKSLERLVRSLYWRQGNEEHPCRFALSRKIFRPPSSPFSRRSLSSCSP
jgi:hypothetical protein